MRRMLDVNIPGESRGGSGAGSLGGARQLTGGGSTRNFPGPPKIGTVQWGGVVAEIFRVSSPETDPIRSRERL